MLVSVLTACARACARACACTRSPTTHHASSLPPARVARCRPLYPLIAPDGPGLVVPGDYNLTLFNFGNTSRPYCSFQPSADLAARLGASAEAEKVRG